MSGAEDTVMPYPEVVRLVQAGGDEGMTALYGFLSRSVRPHLLRRMSVQDATDALHDIFLEVVRAIQRDQLRDAKCPMGFARTVARRRVALYLGILIRTRRDQAEFAEVLHLCATPGPERELIYRQQREVVGKALIQLSSRERDVLIRYYFEEQDQEQICSEMGLTETQFRLLKWRSKARFAELSRKILLGRRGMARSAAPVKAVPA